jgi:hypothetical protein
MNSTLPLKLLPLAVASRRPLFAWLFSDMKIIGARKAAALEWMKFRKNDID